ncbi:MAG: cyclic pyranopterin monophosphate synthase MoaC [Chitinivibrionales bacterium]|nr:cyclic pyranopterin monophosphate synthase MoaC [Chitinivibrionales bacterium]
MKLSHIDSTGAMRMVDVSVKPPQKRTAIASGAVCLAPATVALLKKGLLKKGDALAAAKVAGIMAAKKTGDLIPLCHNLPLDNVDVTCDVLKDRITIRATAVSTGKTGVEMEALTAVCVAALTLYDMCKAVDKNMHITAVRLVQKKKEALS